MYPTIIGRPNHDVTMQGADAKDIYVGDEAQARRGILKLSYPIEHGNVKDWDGIKKIWHHSFYEELRVDPTTRKVLFTETPLNSVKNRENMCRIMFEEFNVKGFQVQISSILALYASGRSTGIVLDCGAGSTSVCPIYEGYEIKHATDKMNLGGYEIDLWMRRCLQTEGHEFETTADMQIVRDIKEKMSFVIPRSDGVSPSENLKQSIQKYKKSEAFVKEYIIPDGNKLNITKEYTMPDGNTIKINQCMFKAPELLFQPHLNGFEYRGVHQLIIDSILKCDVDVRSELCQNVVVAGGSTLTRGFTDRLQRELQELVPEGKHINITAPEDRMFSVFIGGLILTSLPTFDQCWITPDEYLEFGADIVNRKCL